LWCAEGTIFGLEFSRSRFCVPIGRLMSWHCKESFGGCQGQPSARPWHLLISSLGLAALLSSSSFRLCTQGIALLFTISSSSIDSLCDSCSACLLPTVHPGNMPYRELHMEYGTEARRLHIETVPRTSFQLLHIV